MSTGRRLSYGYLPVCLCLHMSYGYMPACLPIVFGLFACLPMLLLVCLMVCRPVGLSVGRSLHRSVGLPPSLGRYVRLPACLPVGLSVSLPVCRPATRAESLRLLLGLHPPRPRTDPHKGLQPLGNPPPVLAAEAVASVIPSC